MESAAIDYAMKALYLVLMLSMPPIIVASAHRHPVEPHSGDHPVAEQTLTFGVKLLAVVLTLFIMGGWLSGEILRYADDIFSRFYMIR